MKRTIMNITGRQSRQDHASIRVYEANDSNENILASDAAMAYTRLNYCTILEARLGEAQKEKDASEEELTDAVGEEERADTMRASKDEEISDLLRQLKALLGEKNFQKVMQSRPSVEKTQPKLPEKMKDIKGKAILEFIGNPAQVGEEAAEGSQATARATRGKKKVRGGGGERDTVPTACEIGTGM
jgi:hypothetical protein